MTLMTSQGNATETWHERCTTVPPWCVMLVVHQFWIDGYKDFNFMRASAVVKRQSTFMAS